MLRVSGMIGPDAAAVHLAAGTLVLIPGEIEPDGAAVHLAAGTVVLVYGGFRFQVLRHLGTPPVTGHPPWRLADISRKIPGEENRGIGSGAVPDEVSDCRSVPRAPEMPNHRPGSGEVGQAMLGSRGGNATMLEWAVMASGAAKVPG